MGHKTGKSARERKNSKRRERKLSLENLDPRLVLSVNMTTYEAPLNVTEALGSDAVIDVVGERTTYRNLDVAGYDAAPDVAAIDFLEDHAPLLGLPANVAENLEVIDTKFGLASSHAFLQQTFEGIPVHNAQITVSMNAAGHVQTVHTSYSDYKIADAKTTVDLQTAITNAETHAGVTDTWSDGRSESVWMAQEDGSLELAWRTMVHASEPRLQDLLTVVSAVDGRVISQEDRSAHATGTGDVFEPNPYQTQGSAAGMVDNNDATSAALDAQMVTVTLERLNDGTGLLQGEWVDVTLFGGLPGPVADEPSRVYQYDRDDDRFEQVVVYHAVDQIQEYFHGLGFDDDTGTPNGIRDFPTMANAHWFTSDQSFYSTANDAIHFGDGGVDDGEDADIIAHEYGHAIQHDQNPNWGGGEMGAMGEGFGDYLAASFYADYGDPAFQAAHAPAVGEWDAVSYSSDNPPNLRRVDGTKSYPGDLVGQVHADGEIWSASLWHIRSQLGGPVTDQLVLESHFGLPGGASMVDAANAILAADANLNGGANQSVILACFVSRGILTAPDDHSNIATGATSLAVPGTGSGLIDYGNDLDFFEFSAVAGTTYEIEVALGTSTDSTLTLLGSNGATQLGFDDDGGTGGGSLIRWTAATSGNYYAVVGGSSTASIGTYDVTIATIAAPADDHGDLTSTATAVPNPSLTAGNIEVASDSDVFAFTANAGDTYTAKVMLGTLADSGIQIIDTNGTTVIAAEADGGASNLLWSAGTTGTYYAVVTGGSQGTYDFEIEEVADDHGNNAASATAVAVPSTTDGWLEFDADRDFFSFTATAGTGYEFGVILDTLTDSVMRLYDTDGTTELEFDDDDGPGLSSLITWEAPGNGTYYVEVGGFQDARDGTYQLTAATFIPGFDDHGSTAATATPIALNSTTLGDIEENGDADYFAVTVPAGADLTIATGLLTITDTTLTLYDTDGTTQLAFDDDGGPGLDSLISWTAPASGTYYIAVRGYNDIRSGTYDLTVTSSVAPVNGDFDADGDWDCDDIDSLTSQVVNGPFDSAFDMDGDGALDAADVASWLSVAGANNLASGNSYLEGDANLDGVVDVADFNIWNANKFTTNTAWCSGNFNVDSVVDVGDFNIWNGNKFQAADQAALTVDAFSTSPAARAAVAVRDAAVLAPLDSSQVYSQELTRDFADVYRQASRLRHDVVSIDQAMEDLDESDLFEV